MEKLTETFLQMLDQPNILTLAPTTTKFYTGWVIWNMRAGKPGPIQTPRRSGSSKYLASNKIEELVRTVFCNPLTLINGAKTSDAASQP
jgi:hypothetical protein